MAGGGPIGSKVTQLESDQNRNYTAPMIIMTALFFMIGFITVLNDVLIPSLQGVFHLTINQTQNITLVFFGAYGIMAVPAGLLIGRVGYKKGLMMGLAVMGIGLLLFVPAAKMVSWPFFLTDLFIVASGLTILQVAINPYIPALGPPETAASRLNLGGAFNSVATFIGPILGSFLILAGTENLSEAEKAEHVQGPYIGLAVLTILIAVALNFIKLPQIISEKKSGEKLKGTALKFSHLRNGALAIFFYVGAEVAIGSLLVLYLNEKYMGGIAHEYGSNYLAYYWGGAMIGRFAGSIILQKIKASRGLAFVTAMAMLLVTLSMFGTFIDTFMDIRVIDIKTLSMTKITVPVASLLLILVGLFNSIMWPSIFPLAIRDLGRYTSQGSGILVTMVIGGALIPKLQGFLISGAQFDDGTFFMGFEGVGWKWSYLLVVGCYAYLFWYAIKGCKVKTTDIVEGPVSSPEATI